MGMMSGLMTGMMMPGGGLFMLLVVAVLVLALVALVKHLRGQA